MVEKPHAEEKPPTGSFLVRVWLEPREEAAEPPEFRGYVRDLRTGEDYYVADPEILIQRLLSRLDPAKARTEQRRDQAS